MGNEGTLTAYAQREQGFGPTRGIDLKKHMEPPSSDSAKQKYARHTLVPTRVSLTVGQVRGADRPTLGKDGRRRRGPWEAAAGRSRNAKPRTRPAHPAEWPRPEPATPVKQGRRLPAHFRCGDPREGAPSRSPPRHTHGAEDREAPSRRPAPPHVSPVACCFRKGTW